MNACLAPTPGAPILRICILGIILTLNIELDARSFHLLSGLSRMNTMFTQAGALSCATQHHVIQVFFFFAIIQCIFCGPDTVIKTLSTVARYHGRLIRGRRRVAEILSTGRIQPKRDHNSIMSAIQHRMDGQLDLLEVQWTSEVISQSAWWWKRMSERMRDFV